MRGGEHDGGGEGAAGDEQGPRDAGHPGPAPHIRGPRGSDSADPPWCPGPVLSAGGGLCASFCLNCNYLIIDYTRL